jgi:hypothetical protein
MRLGAQAEIRPSRMRENIFSPLMPRCSAGEESADGAPSFR